jgi:hypothetical protein
MPDIGMCSDDRCPARRICYRYSAVPNPGRQNYGGHPPREAGAKKCGAYWPVCEATSLLEPDIECKSPRPAKGNNPCPCETSLMERTL